jgi:hypothetical protein
MLRTAHEGSVGLWGARTPVSKGYTTEEGRRVTDHGGAERGASPRAKMLIHLIENSLITVG